MEIIHKYSLQAVAIFVSACSPRETVSIGDWQYKGTTLQFRFTPIPVALAENGLTVVTPLGTFLPDLKSHWQRIKLDKPLPDPDQEWVYLLISSVPFTEEMSITEPGLDCKETKTVPILQNRS